MAMNLLDDYYNKGRQRLLQLLQSDVNDYIYLSRHTIWFKIDAGETVDEVKKREAAEKAAELEQKVSETIPEKEVEEENTQSVVKQTSPAPITVKSMKKSYIEQTKKIMRQNGLNVSSPGFSLLMKDIDGNGVPEYMCQYYGRCIVYTYDKKNNKVKVLRDEDTAKGVGSFVNPTNKTFCIKSAFFGGGSAYNFYRLKGSKVTELDYYSEQMSSDCGLVYKKNGNPISREEYFSELEKAKKSSIEAIPAKKFIYGK